MRGVRLLCLALTASGVLIANGVVSGQAVAPAAGAEWRTPAGTVQGTRFSALDQINTANVNRLEEEFRFSTDIEAGHEGQPLVVNGIMYVVTPFPNLLYTLDLLAHGDVLWVFN